MFPEDKDKTPQNSHLHGPKGFRRWAYGRKEDCEPCMDAERRLEEYRRQQQREQSENEQRTFSPSWGEIGTVGLLVLMWLTLGAASYVAAGGAK